MQVPAVEGAEVFLSLQNPGGSGVSMPFPWHHRVLSGSFNIAMRRVAFSRKKLTGVHWHPLQGGNGADHALMPRSGHGQAP